MVEKAGTIFRSIDQYERELYPKRYAREREDPGAEAYAIGSKHGKALAGRVNLAIQEMLGGKGQTAQSPELLLSGPEDNGGTPRESTDSQEASLKMANG